jgi:hypothetical protein
VRSSWLRTCIVSLVLAAGLQIAPGQTLLAGVLLLEHATDHAHTVSLVPEEGHVHLVLSHERPGDEDRAPAEHHNATTQSASEGDHVVHIGDLRATSTPPRPSGVPPTPTITTAVAMLSAPAARLPLLPSLDPHSRSSDALRTVILRLREARLP